MSQFNRFLWTGLVLGLAACGDDVTVTNPPEVVPPTPGITSVSVAPDGATIQVGGTLGMTAAAVIEPGAAAPTWAWSSGSTAVATVAGTTSNATVTAVAPGSAGIRATATSGTSSASGVATVNVVAAPVAPTCAISGVSASPNSANLVVGQTVAVAANVSASNCSAAQLAVTYSSGDATVATVNASGIVTAVAAGSTTITVTSSTDATKKAAMSLTVTAPPPSPTCSISGVAVAPSSASLEVGKTVAVAANVSGTNCTAAQLGVSYSSGDATVATVSASGVVTAVAAGTTTITATSSTDATKKAAMSLTVTAPPPAPTCSISGVAVAPSSAKLNVGSQLAVAANVSGTNCAAAQLGVTYSSSNQSVATVNASGIVTAVAAGTATITATSATDASKSGSMSLTVEVAPPAPGVTAVSVAPDGSTIQVGSTLAMTAAATLEPGAAAPTWAWSSSAPAVATVAGTTSSATVTAVAPGAAGIRATATSGTSSASGLATVNVIPVPAAPTCEITGVSASPSTAALVIGETVAIAANASGTNCTTSQLALTYASSNSAIASVSAAGVVTAVATGSTTITVTSATDATKSASVSISVTAPQPATVSIQSVTTGVTNVPVNLTNVNGQIEITLNMNPGAAPQILKAQALIGGQVVAEQIFPAASAGGPSLAAPTETLVLSTDTRQMKRIGSLYVPVIFNGPANLSARIFVTGSTTPITSNAIPVVMQNRDVMIGGPSAIAPVTTPGVSVGTPAVMWYKGNVNYTGGNLVSYYPVTPNRVIWTSNSGNCANAAAPYTALSGTPQTGMTLSGTWVCSTSQEGTVTATAGIGGLTYTYAAGSQPAPDVISLTVNAFGVAGSAYSVDGESRYNVLSGSYTAPTALSIDNQAPTTTANAIGYLSGGAAPSNCEATYNAPGGAGCWVNSSYNLLGDFTHADGGVGVNTASRAIYVRNTATPPATGCTATAFDVATAAATTLPTIPGGYEVCGGVADLLGNVNTPVPGNNPFGVDNTAPTLTYGAATGTPALVGTLYAQASTPACTNASLTCTNPAVIATVPGQVLSFDITDNVAGVEGTNNVGLQATFAYTVNNGGTQLSVAAASGTFNATTMPCTRPNTATSQINAFTRRITTAFAPDQGCALPGEYTYSVTGYDRAGNASSTFVRKMELNGPAGASAPTVTAVNMLPLYASQSDISFDVFGTDNEDLRSAAMTLRYNTSGGAPIQVVFGPAAGFFTSIFGASWDGSLYLSTPTSGVRMTLPAAYNLRGYADNASVLGGTPPWSTTGVDFTVFDSYLGGAGNPFGTPSAAYTQVIPAPFLTASSWNSTTPSGGNVANPWAAGTNVANQVFVDVGTACKWQYETSTNDPQVVTRLWVANTLPASGPLGVTHVILADITGTPTLVSDNGTTRVYRHDVSGSTCNTFIGTGPGNKTAMMIQSGAAYIFPAQ